MLLVRWLLDPDIQALEKLFSPRILASNLVQTAHVKVSTNDGSCSSVVQRSLVTTVTDTHSVCHCLKVATETCRLFFLSATEESLELVLTLYRFVAMLQASQLLEYVVLIPRGNYCHTHLLTTPFITLAGRPATVSACSLNCSALGKFGSEFGR